MKYRVVERSGKFFPQVKKVIFWRKVWPSGDIADCLEKYEFHIFSEPTFFAALERLTKVNSTKKIVETYDTIEEVKAVLNGHV